MTAQLKDYINNYAAFNEGELNEIVSRFKAKKLKKGEYLFREGDICQELVFVAKGCLRLFYLDGDVEISVWFAFENSSAIDIYSFISEKPTTYFLQAIEDTEILFLLKNELAELYDSHPKMQEMMRNFWEVAILTLIERFTALQRDTAEQRYLDLMAKPPYLQKIPQKYLASFIGVTPTSLSRIRKNIR